MKIKISLFAITLALATLARGATNDLTGLLQKGLFEEEANRDLTAAIANYQSLASAFDKDRQLAATAIFRLGECYRKLGKTNEAVAQYQRIIKEFSDQQTLVTLSQQNLTGLNATPASSHSGANESSLLEAQANLASLQAQIQEIDKMSHDQKRVYVQQNFPNPVLTTLFQEIDLAQQELIKLKVDYTPDHPKYKTAQELLDDLKRKADGQIDGVVDGLHSKLAVTQAQLNALRQQQTEIVGTPSGGGSGGNDVLLRLQIERMREQLADSEKRLQELLMNFLPTNSRVIDQKQIIDSENTKLAALTEKLQSLQGSGSEGSNPVTTDEEQQEIRRIQLMIQNSPDLINADGGGTTVPPLTSAAASGYLTVAKYLLDHGADVNGLSANHGQVPLLAATAKGHKAMVELLLSRGADVSARGLNPLYEAVKNGYLSVVEVLLANKADVNLRAGTDVSGKRPIHAAAQDGRTDLLQLLIKHGADVNVADAAGETPLHLAAMRNDTNTAKILLDSKAELEAKERLGNTPLHDAADAGNTAMVSLLLNSGATVDPTNGEATAPLMLAVKHGNTDAVRVLLQHKANPNLPGVGMSVYNPNETIRSLPIIFAIWKRNNDILNLLLDAGANPEGDPRFAIPLGAAMNNPEAVQLLLARGANPNRSFNGYPALNSALANGIDKRIVSLLLDKGADANARDSQGYTPLFRTSDPELGKWLVDHKADVNARVTNQRTLLMQAVQTTNFLEFLLEAGANPNLQDTNGNTALHEALYRLATDSVALLLAHKADPNIQNNLGYTPLDLAKVGAENHTFERMLSPGLASPNSLSPEVFQKISALLTDAGGLANLPKRNRIEVRRASNFAFAFTKGSHDWNRYSLLEMIAGEYKLLTQDTAGVWHKSSASRGSLWDQNLRFPDFKNVVVYHRPDASAKQKATNVDVEDILHSGDCSRDMWLDWGDVIEIPESDHPVDVSWPGLSAQTVTALTNCLARQVTVIVKGTSTPVKLSPEVQVQLHTVGNENSDSLQLTYVSFMLRSVLDNSKLVRVSSDLSRVKVTRIDPDTKKKQEWTVDCTNPDQADLWLRDGDVIDVPEK